MVIQEGKSENRVFAELPILDPPGPFSDTMFCDTALWEEVGRGPRASSVDPGKSSVLLDFASKSSLISYNPLVTRCPKRIQIILIMKNTQLEEKKTTTEFLLLNSG